MGNQTTIRTSGKISVSAAFVNRLSVEAVGTSSVSLVEVFAGINASTISATATFSPAVTSLALPDVTVNSDVGDITVWGVGGNPASEAFADILSLHFHSNDGKIKVEVNGGGVNANYSVTSGSGSAIVEIDGESVDTVGELGEGSSGLNEIVIRSERDDVQMALLASPL